ncbi:MAG: WD40 repeat domain-containing protein, partial [Thermoguttaceae bacterium]
KANKALPPLTGAAGSLRVVAFSPDGQRVAAGGSDLKIHVWDLASGREPLSVPTDEVHIESISALAWSPCGTMIASSCDGGLSYQGAAVWNVEPDAGAHRKLGNLPQHAGGDRALVWLASAPVIIGTGSGRDGRTRYYDVNDGTVHQDSETGSSLLCRVGATDKVVLVQLNGDVRFCEPSGLGRSVAKLPTHPGAPSALAIAPDARTVACGSQDGSIRLIDAATGESLRLDAEGSVRSLVFSPETDPEKSKLAVTSQNWNESRQRMESATTIYDAKKHKQLWSFDLSSDERIDDLAWSPDGKLIATAGDSLKIWDGLTGTYRDEFEGEAESVAWVRGGAAIALGSRSAVELVDAKDGSDLLSFADATDARRLLGWSEAAGRLALSAGKDGAAEIVLLSADPGTAPTRVSIRGQDQPVIALGWEADGKTVLTGTLSESCGWDAATAERTSRTSLGSQAFSTDGKLGLIGGPSTIRIHRPQARQLLRTILIFADHKYAAIAPDGAHDGSCQADDIVYVVQTQQGQATLDEQKFAAQYGWKNDPSKLAPQP